MSQKFYEELWEIILIFASFFTLTDFKIQLVRPFVRPDGGWETPLKLLCVPQIFLLRFLANLSSESVFVVSFMAVQTNNSK